VPYSQKKKHQASEIKRHEDELDKDEISGAQRKELEDSLPVFKARLESLQSDEQEQQGKVTDAEQQQRLEQAKLDALLEQLDRLVQALDKTHLATSP
jgi:hypothetical protein